MFKTRFKKDDCETFRQNGSWHLEFKDVTWWFKNGCRHREDGPAVESDDCSVWWFNGLIHRIDGPAVEYAHGTKEWYINGVRHREDGPAIENAYGGNVQHYLNGKPLSKEEWEKTINV